MLPPLLDATPEDFRAGLDARRFTSVDPVKAYIAHMEEVAVTEIDPDSLSVAPMLDPIRRGADNALSLEALHGIPVLLNGNMATDDGMNTTADSSALLGAQPKRDTTVAAKLRKPLPCSGRPICHSGRTGGVAPTPCSWSLCGGQTVGAYHPGQDPSRLSSGSTVTSHSTNHKGRHVPSVSRYWT